MATRKPLILQARAGEAKMPDLERLYGDRYRLTRYRDAGQLGEVPPDLFSPFGETADIADVTGNPELANLCFVATGFADSPQPGKKWTTLVFETLTNTFVDEEPPVIDYELNGLKRITRKLIALPGTPYTYAQGASTQDGCTLGLLKDNSTDYAARLTLVFLEPGQLSQKNDYRNNGKLELRSLTHFGQVPGTPIGFVLVDTEASEVEGIPTRTYQFAKGEGQISRENGSSNNGALLTASIRHLTGPTGTDPLTSLSGYARVSDSMQEADGHRIWSASFAKGNGQISYDPSSANNGKLLTISIRHLTGPTDTNPINTPSGFATVDGPSYQEADGHRIWSASFAKGVGLVRVKKNAGPIDGTIEVTHVSLGPAPINDSQASTPAGILIDSDDNEENGYIRYVRTAISAVSGTITGTKRTYLDRVDVKTPGTVNLTTQSVTVGGVSGTVAVIETIPPRIASVTATVTVEITTATPSTITKAYDLGAISCSVTMTKGYYNYRGFDYGSYYSGGTLTKWAMPRISAGIDASIQHYPNHYLLSTSAEGTFDYPAGAVMLADGTMGLPQRSYETTKLVGNGATEATGYTETGIIERKVRDVFTALNGTTYYEVITWSTPSTP